MIFKNLKTFVIKIEDFEEISSNVHQFLIKIVVFWVYGMSSEWVYGMSYVQVYGMSYVQVYGMSYVRVSCWRARFARNISYWPGPMDPWTHGP